MGYARECWYDVIKKLALHRVNHLARHETAVISGSVATFVNRGLKVSSFTATHFAIPDLIITTIIYLPL